MLQAATLDLLAGIPVTTYAVALHWYERLLGSPPTFFPHDTEAVWELAEHRYVYIVEQPEHAGHAMHTLSSTTSIRLSRRSLGGDLTQRAGNLLEEMSGDSRSAMGIVCTFDGGHTWAARPYLCTSAPCSAEGYIEFGETLAADGSVLLIAPDKSMRLGLYRLPAHSSQWEYLGSVNGSNALVYAPISTGGGVLWLYAGGGSPSNLSGSIGSHFGSLPNVLLSTAIYP